MENTEGNTAGAGSIRELLHARGLRYSQAREAILRAFLQPGAGHLSAEDLHRTLSEAGADISLSTVYLNLAVLRDAGLLQEFRGPQGQAMFDPNPEPHHHVVCADTGDVHDLPDIEIGGLPLSQFLREEIRRRTGWEIEEAVLSLRGRRH